MFSGHRRCRFILWQFATPWHASTCLPLAAAASDPALLQSRVEKSLRINASIAWPACAVASQLEHSHHCHHIYGQMVSSAAAALRVLRQRRNDRGGLTLVGVVLRPE